jgi:hypothetical protein
LSRNEKATLEIKYATSKEYNFKLNFHSFSCRILAIDEVEYPVPIVELQTQPYGGETTTVIRSATLAASTTNCTM